MQEYLEFASSVQPTVQRVDGIPTLERHERKINLCSNSEFQNFNDTDGSIYSGEVRNTRWKMYSPLFTSPVDYRQAFNFQYRLPYPPYQNTTSLVDSPANWIQIPPRIHKAVKMFGVGNDFGLELNQNADRTFAEPPIVGLKNKTVDDTTAWGDTGTWTRYDRYQTIRTTADTITFGAWVRCDPNDALRQLNMGGLYLWQDVSGSLTGPRTVKVNAMVVKRASNTPNLDTGQLATGQGHYHFSGMNHLEGEKSWEYTGYDKYRWNDYLTVEGIDYYDAEDLGSWTRIEKTVTLQGASGSMKRVGLAMFFAENCSYLNGDGTLTGSVDFYYPYVTPVSAETATSVSTATGTISGAGGASVTHYPTLPITDTSASIYNRNSIAVPFYINLDAGKIVEYIDITGIGNIGPQNFYAGVNYNNLNGRTEMSFDQVRFKITEYSATSYDARLKGGANGATHSATLYVPRGTTGTATINIRTIDE